MTTTIMSKEDMDAHASKTLEVVPDEVVDAELVDDTIMSKTDAEMLDKKIRTTSARIANGLDALLPLMEAAVAGQIDKALGFRSLSDYFNDAIEIAPTDSEERKLMVAAMSGKGMSQRAIASSLGVNQATVSRDIAEASDAGASPGVTVSIDGSKRERKEKPAKVELSAQAKALETALNAVLKAGRDLEAAFAGAENFEPDVTPELIHTTFTALRKAFTAINKIGGQFKDLK